MGRAGTNFFVFTGDRGQAVAWKHDHTIWGELADPESFAAVKRLYELPVKGTGTHSFVDKVCFEIRLL